MFYISRKVGRKWGVIDTKDNIEEFYFSAEIKRFVDSGISIKGAEYVRGVFTLSSTINVNSLGDIARNKILTGSGSGYKGFDLVVDKKTNDVIAKSLTDDFKKYIADNAINSRYVLVIPEIVTVLGEDFLSPSSCIYDKLKREVKITVVLPKSLRVIQNRALNWWGITDVVFNSHLERIEGGDSFCSLRLTTSSSHFKIPISRICTNSIIICANTRVIDLSDVSYIEDFAFSTPFRRSNPIFWWGYNINTLRSITGGFEIVEKTKLGNYSKVLGSHQKQIMNNAVIIDIPDNSLRKICMRDINSYPNEVHHAYIVIMSRKEYDHFMSLPKSICKKCAIGVMTYKNEEEHTWLLDNIIYACQHYRASFKNVLDMDSFGKITELSLKLSK